MNGGHGNLRGVIGGAALDGRRKNPLSGLLALGLHLLLGIANDGRRLMGNLTADLIEKLTVRVISRELRDALELFGLLGIEVLKLTAALLNLPGLAGKLVLALVERIVSPVKRFLALHDAVLERAKLALALFLLRFRSLLVLDNLFFCLEKSFLLQGLCLSLRFADHLVCLSARRFDSGIRFAKAAVLGVAHGDDGDDGAYGEANDNADDNLHAHSSNVKSNSLMAHGCARHLRGMNTQYEVVYVTQMNSSTMSVHHKTNDRIILRFKSKTVNSTQHQLRLYEGITRPLSA